MSREKIKKTLKLLSYCLSYSYETISGRDF